MAYIIYMPPKRNKRERTPTVKDRIEKLVHKALDKYKADLHLQINEYDDLITHMENNEEARDRFNALRNTIEQEGGRLDWNEGLQIWNYGERPAQPPANAPQAKAPPQPPAEAPGKKAPDPEPNDDHGLDPVRARDARALADLHDQPQFRQKLRDYVQLIDPKHVGGVCLVVASCIGAKYTGMDMSTIATATVHFTLGLSAIYAGVSTYNYTAHLTNLPEVQNVPRATITWVAGIHNHYQEAFGRAPAPAIQQNQAEAPAQAPAEAPAKAPVAQPQPVQEAQAPVAQAPKKMPAQPAEPPGPPPPLAKTPSPEPRNPAGKAPAQVPARPRMSTSKSMALPLGAKAPPQRATTEEIRQMEQMQF